MAHVPQITAHDRLYPLERLEKRVSGGWTMSENEVRIGQLVSSLRGRDSGLFYLVVQIESESRVRIADGEGRKAEKPKSKNIKHLKFYDIVADSIFDKAQIGKRITSEDVRKELQSLVYQLPL
jgi:ribosomal protein L14E/L6E/L27E